MLSDDDDEIGEEERCGRGKNMVREFCRENGLWTKGKTHASRLIFQIQLNTTCIISKRIQT